jgi:uncharacterized protein YjiS (DUF1127 family)
MTLLFADHEEALPRGTLARAGIRALAKGFTAWRQQRARRIALISLVEMDAYRLDDLGITVEALRDAINAR